jgi:uncharacterized protein (TIGR02300 family)
VAKPELGGKRQCQNCGAKFFDLNRNPIVCPKCGAVFQATPARASSRAAAREEDEEEAAAPAELVSLEEADAAPEKAVEGVEDIDIDDDESADDDTFLEEEEEGDDDVADLIDGDIETDEEG